MRNLLELRLTGYMANPQVEDGHLKIALDLAAAIAGTELTGLQLSLVIAVMYITYGNSRKLADVTIEDLRLILSGNRRIRSYRIREALEGLANKHVVVCQKLAEDKFKLGIQKDFEKWLPVAVASKEEVHQIGTSINRSINNNINTSHSDVPKIGTTICLYAHKEYQGTYGIGAYRTELKHAKQLYREALVLTRDPVKAAVAIKDYIDDLNGQEWFSQCKMRLVYMSSRFKAWHKALPPKPKTIKDQEEITGYKFRYNRQTKQWEMTSGRRT